jgi:hypothetical protein
MARHTIALRPVAYQKLKDLTEELSKQAGWKLTMAAVVEMAIEHLDRLESMKDENDIASYRGKTAGK